MAARTLGKLRVAIIFIIVQLSLLLICWNGSSFHIIVRAASDQPKMSSTVSCFPSDGQALASFAAAVPDVYLSESWSSEHDCCTWMGVTCTDATAGYARVTGLSLLFDHLSILPSAAATSNILEVLCHLPLLSTLELTSFFAGDLQGLQVPECFGEQLPLLHSLTLDNLGNFKDPLIPSSFSRLRHLQYLDIDAVTFNSFNSPPSISCSLLPLLHLPSLTTLYITGCSFSDPLPDFHTPLLQSLNLFEASFSSAPLTPTTFNGTPLLQSLALSTSTSISSPLVDHMLSALSNLTALADLHLSGSFISGFMSALSNLSALISLSLFGQMDISGPIPVSISRLSNLQYLSLLDNNLSGALPDWLCELSHLVSVQILYSKLSTAELENPESCRQLINLTTLDLSSNDFTGPFPPWIGHFRSLEVLDLSSNGFAGSIPDEWENLHNLHTIHLGSTGNSLNGSTQIPDWLFRHPQLRVLGPTSLGLQTDDVLCDTRVSMLNKTLVTFDVSGNNITGRDLLECFALHSFTKLTDVFMDRNPLSTTLADIQLAPTISVLSLSACNLTGFLNHKVLEGHFEVYLSHNHLVGKIPTKQANFTALTRLDLSNNHFSGFDSEFGSLTSLQHINLSSNSIAGELESVLRILGLNCSTISTKGISLPLVQWISMDLSYNELVGQIPPNLGECANDLQSLFLDHNNLSGTIPQNLPRYLSDTKLDNNQLKGNIPASVVTNSIILLELGYNELEGDLKILFSHVQCAPNLLVLDLAHNLISGSIPPSLGDFMPAVIVIDLSHNNLTGNIPRNLHLPSFHNISIFLVSKYIAWELPPLVIKGVVRTLEVLWNDFRFLDLSHNYLEGVIPAELGEFSALMQLNLSHNRLAGPIPEAFGKLSMLEVLDLSFNKLQGSLPMSLARLTKLSVFNVSYNKELEGSIPPGPQLANKESYTGDPLLCGHPVLEKPCSQGGDARSPFHSVSNIEEASSTWIDEWIAIPGLCVGLVVGFLGTLWLLHGPQLRH